MFMCPRGMFQSAPEARTPESVVSDDEGVLVSKEEVEESISKAVVSIPFGAIEA
jgi:hypothetical protein